MTARAVIAVLVALIALTAVAFLTVFRYQYVKSGSRTDRVDRITGVVCTMPCLPATPAPSEPPPELEAQRAISAVKERTDAVELVSIHSADDGGDRYEWAAVQARNAAVNGIAADDSTYVVCYCRKDTNGFRWEVHLKSGEIFYMNDNANLSHMYGLTIPSPSPSPISEPAGSSASDASPGANQPTVTKSAIVESFYHYISSKDFASAYALLSPEYKKGTSFAQFVRGYATTLSVNADAEDSTADDDVVNVTLHAEDSRNGSEVETTYVGSWKLVQDDSGQWLLDTGSFTH